MGLGYINPPLFLLVSTSSRERGKEEGRGTKIFKKETEHVCFRRRYATHKNTLVMEK